MTRLMLSTARITGIHMANMADVVLKLGQKLTIYLFLSLILASFILRKERKLYEFVSTDAVELYVAKSISLDSLQVSTRQRTNRPSYKVCRSIQLVHLTRNVLFVNLILLCGDVLQNPGSAIEKCYKCNKTIRRNQGRAICAECTHPYH